LWLIALTVVQIALGVTVIWFGVPLILALSHQAVALFMFVLTIFINYRLVHEPLPYPGQLESQMELTAA
jgi:heme A synthase